MAGNAILLYLSTYNTKILAAALYVSKWFIFLGILTGIVLLLKNMLIWNSFILEGSFWTLGR